jgi:putative DNA primase/helicase
MLKKLTGQDLIGYEYKNKNLFEDMNYAKILISTNNLPPTTDKTVGFYRRWTIIDFPNRFDEGKSVEENVPEFEFENLARKCVKILKEVLEYGKFTNEGTIEERTKKFEELSNPFDKFWKENVDEGEGFIGKSDFKYKLEGWCKENKFRTISDRTIDSKMKEMRIFDSRQDYYKDGERKQFRIWNMIKWKGSVTNETEVTRLPISNHICEEDMESQVTADTTDTKIPISDVFNIKTNFKEEKLNV